ncbi:CTP synthase [Candidatus Collierbacteria bacterium]|nr:CTP synthase [Candidatus Collierbacteria bacterium]
MRQVKYIFISGGVLSGLGKGIASASIGFLLKSRGIKVTPVKCENYLNIDSGLINPIEHGDPFLCEDGTESDMDLGTYERFLDQNMGWENFVTMGQIYRQVIEDERNYKYKGEDVEAIPHVVNEIIRRIKLAGEKTKADIVLVELGGTTGEYQNVLYYEAAREMKLEDLRNDHGHKVIHIHVSYLPIPKHLGEPKTKPTQLSIRTLMGMGIQPDFLIARCEKEIDARRKYLLSLTCNLRDENIVSSPDVSSVYQVPLGFKKQNLDIRILKALNLQTGKSSLNEWNKLVNSISSPKKHQLKIAIVGKYFKTGREFMLGDSYAALFEALKHAAWGQAFGLNLKWISAEEVEEKDAKKLLSGVDGIVVPIGWGKRGAEGKISAVHYARINKVPFLGLCYGMQLACVEFARYELGLKDANTSENDPTTSNPIIHDILERAELMTIKSRGVAMRLGGWDFKVKPGTILDHIYSKHNLYINSKDRVGSVRHRHRFEFNNDYIQDLEKKGMVISAMSVKGNFVDWVELPQSIHPFFIGTQGHPEYSSRPLKPHPVFLEFLKACYNNQLPCHSRETGKLFI